ncbi:MAG: NUDIX domain-containing protein [Clostridia bacterium]|nr:NUDIX domain-containing protein [Clostridia bacterium]
MNIEFHEINDLNKPSIVVIYAKYKDKIVMCRHEKRETWEIPGGHIENNETPEMAARREMYEETGATDFTLTPVCKYSFKINEKKIFGIMYKSTINIIKELSKFEIKEVRFFDELPENVTYPEIYAEILKK